MVNPLKLVANNIANTFRGNIAALSGGYDLADTLHNVYADYGYPYQLVFYNFWNMYRRLGIANNIVELPVMTGWRTPPIIEAGGAFDTAFEELEKQLKLFDRLAALDKRQRVGRYAGLFIRVRDNMDPVEPMADTLSGGVAAIISIIPIYEGNLTVATVDNDPLSDRFGLPVTYNYNSSNIGNRDDKFATSVVIHHSRLVIAAEDADDGGIYGISSLEAPYNSLLDIRKIVGAGGEGFYRNASKDIMFSTAPDTSNAISAAALEKMEEQADDFTHNRMRRSLFGPGLTAETLDSTLANPKEYFMNALYDCAAASKIPATILIGQQTGRLASDEDSAQYLSTVQSRREGFQTDLIETTINWFIDHGVLPSAEYEVIWDDLLAPSDDEKLKNAESMSKVNQTNFLGGGDIVFDEREMREAAGFEAEELPEPRGEEDDDIAEA